MCTYAAPTNSLKLCVHSIYAVVYFIIGEIKMYIFRRHYACDRTAWKCWSWNVFSETLKSHYYLLRLFWQWCICVISRREFGDSQFGVQRRRFMTGLLTVQSIYTHKGCRRAVFCIESRFKLFYEKQPSKFFVPLLLLLQRDGYPPGCKALDAMYYA